MNLRFDPLAEIRRLRQIIDARDEEIRQLRDANRNIPTFPRTFRLTPAEARIVWRLVSAAPSLVSRESLSIISSGKPLARRAGEKTLDVQLSRIRRKLTPYGVLIHNIYGEGFMIDANHARRLKELTA